MVFIIFTVTAFNISVFKLQFAYVCSAFQILGLPWSVEQGGMDVSLLKKAIGPELGDLPDNDAQLWQRLKIESLYATAVIDQLGDVRQVQQDEAVALPEDLNYHQPSLHMLSTEERNKLSLVRPTTVILWLRNFTFYN